MSVDWDQLFDEVESLKQENITKGMDDLSAMVQAWKATLIAHGIIPVTNDEILREIFTSNPEEEE